MQEQGVIKGLRAGAFARPLDVGLWTILASTSGAAILAHVFGPLRMVFTVPFVVIPSSFAILAFLLVRRRLYSRLLMIADLIALGGLAGLAATLAYDAIRPLLKAIFAFKYSPYAAMPVFGQLMTGLSPTDARALAAGWLYHFWNGISFGMIYALLWPRGGALSGLLWGLGLQGLMMITYPRLLHIRIADPGFLTMGLVGHAVWGVVLGTGVRMWAQKYIFTTTRTSGSGRDSSLG